MSSHKDAQPYSSVRRCKYMLWSAVDHAKVRGTTPVFRKDDRTASCCARQKEGLYYCIPSVEDQALAA